MVGNRGRGWAAGVLILVLAPGARAQEFRWIDEHGQARSARRADDVPRGDWRTVLVEARGAEATSGERFRTAQGMTVVIEGIQAPGLEADTTAVSEGGTRALARLDALIRNADLTIEFEGDRRLPDGAYLAHVVRDDGRLIAEILLEEGLVRLCLEENAMRHQTTLRAALARAQAAQAGVWKRAFPAPPPEPRVQRGVSLGLFAQSPDFDYGPFLDEIKEAGASHVLIPSPWLMHDFQSNDFGPVQGRTAGWPTLKRVTRQARERGLSVSYLPLVLLRTGTQKYWRGNIEPTQRWLWYRNYHRYLGRWADMARDLGVSLLSVGSEFSSLERETAAWRNVIANVRSRYPGRLTYSSNWDHVDVIGFWDDLDVIGMTGYHSLTRSLDPTVDELAAAWRQIQTRLLRHPESFNKPWLFTEIGYASQNGTNTDPWNYYLYKSEKDLDHQEQADCYEALFRVFRDAPPGFRGMYIWNWWRHEDPATDRGYSVVGKPAYALVTDYFAHTRESETRPLPSPVHATEVLSGERFRTAERFTIVIEGIQAPAVEDDGTAASAGGSRALARLAELIANVPLSIEFEGDRRLPDGAYLAHPRLPDGRLVAEILLEEGLVHLALESGAQRYATPLRAAHARGRASATGHWARPLPEPMPEAHVRRGVVLSLAASDPEFDYEGFLDEIKDVGASHVLIPAPWTMETWQSNDFSAGGNWPGFATIQRVTQQARARGLGVAYQPLVVVRKESGETRRLHPQPTQPWLWFRNYNRFVGRLADLADDLGVSLLCVGSDLPNLEAETADWTCHIANLRARYDGRVAYVMSHGLGAVPSFCRDVDCVGVPGYDALTGKNDPTIEELVAAWTHVRGRIEAMQAAAGKPVFISEVGYTSQDGTNRNPRQARVNPRKPDPGEQADCFRALFQAWKGASPSYEGLFVANWWRQDKPAADIGYSVFGKPAHAVIRDAFRRLEAAESRPGADR